VQPPWNVSFSEDELRVAREQLEAHSQAPRSSGSYHLRSASEASCNNGDATRARPERPQFNPLGRVTLLPSGARPPKRNSATDTRQADHPSRSPTERPRLAADGNPVYHLYRRTNLFSRIPATEFDASMAFAFNGMAQSETQFVQ
jgi:hypothetical protein